MSNAAKKIIVGFLVFLSGLFFIPLWIHASSFLGANPPISSSLPPALPLAGLAVAILITFTISRRSFVAVCCVNAVLAVALVAICALFLNKSTWLGHENPEKYSFERAKTTPEGLLAGKKYMDIMLQPSSLPTLSSGPIAELSRLIEVPHWNFDGEDPRFHFYNKGVLPKQFDLPIIPQGVGFELFRKNLIELSTGIHLAEIHQLLPYLAGECYYLNALSFVKQNPSLESSLPIKLALERGCEFPKLYQDALYNEVRDHTVWYEKEAAQNEELQYLVSHAILQKCTEVIPDITISNGDKGKILNGYILSHGQIFAPLFLTLGFVALDDRKAFTIANGTRWNALEVYLPSWPRKHFLSSVRF